MRFYMKLYLNFFLCVSKGKKITRMYIELTKSQNKFENDASESKYIQTLILEHT